MLSIKNKFIRFLAHLFPCLAFCLSLQFPVFAAEPSAGTGGVSISLEAYSLDNNGKRIPFTEPDGLVPGQKIPYILIIQNNGNDAWVRVKVKYVSDVGSGENAAGDSWLKGIGDSWVKRGDYWYYMETLDAGSRLDFCTSLQVPDLSNVPEEVTFKINARAEAVQAANVTPNFTAENPFAGLLVDDSDAVYDDATNAAGFIVSYGTGAENIVDASKLFTDINDMMPGDVRTGTVTVNNSNDYRIHVVLKEKGNQTRELLLKQMKLTIYKNGKTLYDGDLTDDSLVNGLSLGNFAAKTTTSLTFKLELPKEVMNQTAFTNINLEWEFTASRIYTGGHSGSSSGTGTSKADAATVYSSPDGSLRIGYSGGKWSLLDDEKRTWEFVNGNGTKAADGWVFLYNPYSSDGTMYDWFYFNADAVIEFGWIKTENGNWYYCNPTSNGRLGHMITGWHHDPDDGRTYYLDPTTGIMQTGWREIDGEYYYFAGNGDVPKQNWFWDSGIGKWVYDLLGFRTYGSLYKNEKTPDGYTVNENGAWDKLVKGGLKS